MGLFVVLLVWYVLLPKLELSINPSLPGVGEIAERVAPPEPPETITVSISKDGFKPARFQMAIGQPLTRLSEQRPKEIAEEPEYAGKKQLYGWLDLGIQENNRHYFCFDEQSDGQYLLHFDRNKNGDLTDDGDAVEFERSAHGGPGGSLVTVPWSQLTDDAPFKGDFDVWIFSNKRTWAEQSIAHHSRTHLAGTITLSGREYKALLVDRYKNDGDLTNDGIAIDLNGNGRFDGWEYRHSKHVIDGKSYHFNVTW
jgi:hypothetical protein